MKKLQKRGGGLRLQNVRKKEQKVELSAVPSEKIAESFPKLRSVRKQQGVRIQPSELVSNFTSLPKKIKQSLVCTQVIS